MNRTTRYRFVLLFLSIAISISGLSVPCVNAQPAAPSLSSQPGASYTLYLNFTGFTWTGNWNGQAPPVVPAYGGQTGPAFTAQQEQDIRLMWTRVAEAYAPFNVNVTTVDPAVAAGAVTDFERQQYYSVTPRVMHSIVGDVGSSFQSGAAGISYVNTWSTNAGSNHQLKTNWTFTNRIAGSRTNVGRTVAHENGHAAGLRHQGDYIGTTLVNTYTRNNNSSSISAFMGTGFQADRYAWRVGGTNTPSNGTMQNDVQGILQSNSGMGLFNDGIGRLPAEATPLALVGSTINSSLAAGVIVPVNPGNPQPIGVDNYTRGFYSFSTVGGLNTITVNAGAQWITPGVVDLGSNMLDATLRILDSAGVEVAVADTDSLSETLSVHLTAGNYLIEVSSAGGKHADLGPDGNWNPAQYFDMGSYFLTGSIAAIPEPGMASVLLVGTVYALIRRRRSGSI